MEPVARFSFCTTSKMNLINTVCMKRQIQLLLVIWQPCTSASAVHVLSCPAAAHASGSL